MSVVIQSHPCLFDVADDVVSPRSKSITEALHLLASNSNAESRGAIFTRVEVVGFILDLVGYTSDRPLHRQSILEPSFGEGDFLLPMVERLLESWRRSGGDVSAVVVELGGAIRGVELHRASFVSAREGVIRRLIREGISSDSACALADQWLVQGDFLLEAHSLLFDFVVGNPPYVRQEQIPGPLLSEYRVRYSTMYDRADIYVPFIERSLSLLKEGGVLGFICADRWMKNRYGGPLRGVVSKGFHLKFYVDMVDTDAFHSEVSAYPAITVFTRGRGDVTRVARRPKVDEVFLSLLAAEFKADQLVAGSVVREVLGVVNGSEPWILDSAEQLLLIRRLEGQFPALEQVGCRVGIGVATGADKAFIGALEALDVEPDRKIPLVTTRDIQSGEVVWQGQGVINPFTESGALVRLADYPRLARYLEERKGVIARRHCALKSPASWYKTLDRIWPGLLEKPKLLIPDIKGEAHIVFEPGGFYPHHNLYYVVSDTWDLRALQAVLMSHVTQLFVKTYSTQMRGGYLRFQAQYLRRIRLPFWHDVSDVLRGELVKAACSRDVEACNRAVIQLYQLSQDELSLFDVDGGQGSDD